MAIIKNYFLFFYRKRSQCNAQFRDAAHLMHVIQRIVRNAGRRIDERSPMVDARLADGSRINAIIAPLAVDGAQLSIRRFPKQALGLDGLVQLGTLPDATATLLRAAVAGRQRRGSRRPCRYYCHGDKLGQARF